MNKLSEFFAAIFRKNRLILALSSLLLMVVAAFSILRCEKEMINLEKKWRSLYGLKEVWGVGNPERIAVGPRDLTRYDIQVELVRFVFRRVEIRFADKYSFVLSGNEKPSGVYHMTDKGSRELVSRAPYPSPRMAPELKKPETFRLRLACDLSEKTALVYVNGRFTEKISLGPEPVHYNFGLFLPLDRSEVRLRKLQLSGPQGQVLFRADFTLLSDYRLLSQIGLFLGILTFMALGCFETSFFKKLLFLGFPLLFLEVFLRIAYPHDPGLDITQLKPKWRFEISTNFYGAFNDPKVLTIRSYWSPRRTSYPIENPENALRMICVGSSPLVVGARSRDEAFPALLEKKFNAWNQKENRVISLAIPYAVNFNDPELAVFLTEILNKMDVDLVVYYGMMPPPQWEVFNKRFVEDYALYQRAKSVMEKNSGWIKNDRLLYAALEFKRPVEAIVYLYDFLCRSYLFMAMENFRKKLVNEWHSREAGIPVRRSGSPFEDVIELCKKKGTKVIFVPQLDFVKGSNDKQTERSLSEFRGEHPETYYVSLERVFDKNKRFLLASDGGHLTEYGHHVLAEELFRQLMEKKLFDHEASRT